MLRRFRAARAEAELAIARAKASDDQALIAHQQLQIKKLTCEHRGFSIGSSCSSRSWRVQPIGEDEEWLRDLHVDMEPEDGCLWVHGVGEDGVSGFIAYSIECFGEIITIERAAGRAPPKVGPPK